MSLMSEYINKGFTASDYEQELLRLIREYNKIRNSYLFVYSTCMNKQIPAAQLEQSDFYIIRDMLSNCNCKRLDVYIETPGGRGETAEEIVRYLRSKFDYVSFVVSGEAKSAGTIIVLSGNEILMTETGSLGPIDAQLKIGRSVISAYDYVEWVKHKAKEAAETRTLNPFDAAVIAQITPGELEGVNNALDFAKDLVVEWLVKYKFANWNETKKRKIKVTDEMKMDTAQNIAKELINHTRWRSHGRSLKIDDLMEIGLDIVKIDDDPILSDIVYRIQTVCSLLFESSTVFKIFATQENKIFRQAVTNIKTSNNIPQGLLPIANIEPSCPKCGKKHKIYAKFTNDKSIDVDMKKNGYIPFPKDGKIICDCGFMIDLTGIRNQIELQIGKKILFE